MLSSNKPIDRSRRAWLTRDLTNNNAESAILPDKQIRQESRLTSVDLNLKKSYWRLLVVEIKYIVVHSCLFRALSKYEKTIGSRVPLGLLRQYSDLLQHI